MSTEPKSPRAPCSAIRQAVTMRNPHTATRVAPARHKRKSPCSNEDPARPNINKKIHKMKKIRNK